MKSLVVYFSRGGKTRKVAEAIAQQLECEAVDVQKETPDISAVDPLIVGSGTYGGNIGKGLLEFLNNLQTSSNGKAAVFATSGGPSPKSIHVMQEALETKGYKVIFSFECRGQISSLNRGHPTEDDLRNAKAFASDFRKRIIG